MSTFVGRRYESGELTNPDSYHSAEDLAKLSCIRAWCVPALLGARIRVWHTSEIDAAVGAMLRAKLPGIEWKTEDSWGPAFNKYHLIHTSISAPVNERTGEAMALEIFGDLAEIDGISLATPAGREWMDKQMEENCRAGWEPPLAGDMVLVIRSATYANVMFPGVGVPLYM